MDKHENEENHVGILGLRPREQYDILPIPLSIQKQNRIVIYENPAMIQLIGSYEGRFCYERWYYLEDYMNKPCTDCPAAITMDKQHTYSIVRKTVDKNGNTIYLKITHVPIPHKPQQGNDHYFMEIIMDVTKNYQNIRLFNINKLRENFWLAITSFGKSSADLIAHNSLPFIKDGQYYSFFIEMSIYLFTAIGQGHDYNTGLFGVLPVLNYNDYVVFPYAFRIYNPEMNDSRFNNQDYAVLMIFTRIENDRISFFRQEIQDFLDHVFTSLPSIHEITDEFLQTLRNHLLEFIEEQFANMHSKIHEE